MVDSIDGSIHAGLLIIAGQHFVGAAEEIAAAVAEDTAKQLVHLKPGLAALLDPIYKREAC